LIAAADSSLAAGFVDSCNDLDATTVFYVVDMQK
jgi:hypothetical protein